ncbi:PIG-L deacetylase family protein [Caldicellulosiruptoraceae bacterium PP1]
MKFFINTSNKVYKKKRNKKRFQFKRTYILYIFITWLVLTVASFLVREYISNYYFHLQMNNINIDDKQRILIFAPHCDDETLSSAGVIQRAIANGSEVKVVVMTNGDGFTRAVGQNTGKIRLKPYDYIEFGYRRQKETIHALEDLGLERNNIIFLGYPDRGLRYLWEKYFNSKNPYLSSLTRTTRSPYNNSYQKNVEYKGINVVNNIESIISSYKPDLIIYPYSRDQHPDHWATSAFVKFTLLKMDYKTTELQYLVHRGDWPTPFGKRTNMFLVPPFKLAFTDTTWVQFPLNNELLTKKMDAIYDYNSQVRVMRSFLEAFIRQNELFSYLPNITAVRYQGDDIFLDKYKVLSEPNKDSIPLIFESGADIDGIFIAHNEQNYYFGIKMLGSTKRLVDYYIHARLFNRNKYIGRIYIRVTPDKIILDKTLTDKKFTLLGTKIQRNKEFLKLIVPKKDFLNADKIFISLRTEILGRQFDRSAWRVVEFR